MFCSNCHKRIGTNENILKQLLTVNYPEKYCFKCWIYFVLAQGFCKKCGTESRNRINTNVITSMLILKAWYIPKKKCVCGNMIKLNKIVNKEFVMSLWR